MNNASSSDSHQDKDHTHQAVVAGDAKDPVCGMTVVTARAAAKRELNGQSFYFCGASCASKFDANPEQYAKGPVEGKSKGGCCGT